MVKLRQSVLPLALVAVLWEVLAHAGLLNMSFLPPPTKITLALLEMGASGELSTDLIMSVTRALGGFLAGTVVGVLLGIGTARTSLGRYFLLPVLQSLRSIPSIAILPFAILLLGLNEVSKYFLVFWGVFFPVWVNSHIGIAGVDTQYIWAARSLGVQGWRLLWEVVLPAAVPLIVAGMRVGIGLAFLNLVAAEMSGASAGLGYRVSASHLVFRPDKMLAALAALSLLGMAADAAFGLLVKRILPWSVDRS